MDGKHNLHLVDSYPEPQLQPTSHIQHYLATVRWAWSPGVPEAPLQPAGRLWTCCSSICGSAS